VNIYELQGTFFLVVLLVMLAVKGFAFVNAVLFSNEAYEAAGKLTKTAWCAITGLGFAAQLIFMAPTNILNLIFFIAALVYLADVRPALKEVTSYRR
jgi:hypothetical protein